MTTSILAARSLPEVLVSLFLQLCIIFAIAAAAWWLLGYAIKALSFVSKELYEDFQAHPFHAVIFGVVVSCFICWFYLK
jgi:hypothetical protein